MDETTIAKLRNQLGPMYSLSDIVLAIEEHPDKKEQLFKICLEQSKIIQKNKEIIKELLNVLEIELDGTK